MSKIKRISVTNLKAVSSMTADFSGCSAIITGGNNKGKSSFLKSLPDRLRGSKPDGAHMDIFGQFCKACGSEDTGCQCWNDE